MQFSVFGPYRGVTGYDMLVRTMLKEWHFQGHQVGLTEFDRWSNTRGATEIDPLLDLMEKNNQIINPEFHLNFCLMEQAKLNPFTMNCIYTMFEADRIHPGWVESAKKLDAIIVPTEFNKNTFHQSGIPLDKLLVCPPPLDVYALQKYVPSLTAKDFGGEDIRKYKHRFLNVSEYIPRKNVEGLIQAWVDETKPEDDACLILKLNSNLFAKTDFFGNKIKSIIKNKKCAPIFFFNDFVNDTIMLEFYNLCTHYITASCGEGWGMSESMCAVLGKKLIAPNSSSFTDYWDWEETNGTKKCTNGYPIMVQASGAKQDGPTSQYYYNTRWWIPIQYDIRKKIRQSINDANAGDTSKELALSKKLSTKCDATKIAGDILLKIKKHKPIKTVLPIEIQTPNKFNFMTICKSLGTKCGIADYSNMLFAAAQANKDLSDGSLLAYGEAIEYRGILEAYNIHVVNLQVEYQFISAKRLELFINFLKNSKITPVITLHTVNPKAFDYHEVLSKTNCKIIVSSELMKQNLVKFCGIEPENVYVLPMGISKQFISAPKDKPKGSKFRIGFFGFCYPHKGIDKAIRYIGTHGEDKELLILSTKPENDRGYFDSLIQLYQRKPLPAQWGVDFIDEGGIVEALTSCDLIFLPYSEYGGIGVSAAVRTALKAGVPIAAFENSFFSDVVKDSGLITFVGDDPLDFEAWSNNLNNTINFLKGNEIAKAEFINKRNKFIETYNWDVIGRQYVQHLQSLVQKDLICSQK